MSDPQPSFGYIEREDLEKYTFSFDAFFGNPKAMQPGVRVHFTACKDKVRSSLTDTDMKSQPVKDVSSQNMKNKQQQHNSVCSTIVQIKSNYIFIYVVISSLLTSISFSLIFNFPDRFFPVMNVLRLFL